MNRSYLFAPGHNDKLLRKVFDAGADAVILDLEDAVPPHEKDTARASVADALARRSAWVRINAPRTRDAANDLAAVAALAYGIRIPKVESVGDVRWVAERAPGKPLLCAIETAKGVANAHPTATGRSRSPTATPITCSTSVPVRPAAKAAITPSSDRTGRAHCRPAWSNTEFPPTV